MVHGQQAFGRAVLERLREGGDGVVGVFCAPDREGRPTDPLKQLARGRGAVPELSRAAATLTDRGR